jgi:hypothetical protein
MVRSLLYKAEDLRKDQLVSRVLQLMEAKLREAGLTLPIQTYTVTATSIRDGIIEMVPNASTITDINNQYGSVRAYLENVAVNNQEPLSVVRSRFAESYAAFTVMMFLLVRGMRWTSLSHSATGHGGSPSREHDDYLLGSLLSHRLWLHLGPGSQAAAVCVPCLCHHA